MTLNIQLRRNDATGGGVLRTAYDDTQTDITAIDLRVETMQLVVDTKNTVMRRRNPDAKLSATSLTQTTVNIVGVIIGTGTVDAAWFMDDLWYATTSWGKDYGLTTLRWTETKVLSAGNWVSDTERTFSGHMTNFAPSREGGVENQFKFALRFEIGV